MRAPSDYVITLLDGRGRVVGWNRGAERTTDDSGKARDGHPRAPYAWNPPGAALEEELRIARDRGRFDGERWRRRTDGTRFCSHEVVIPLRTGDRRVSGYARISHDCTERDREADTQRFLAEAGTSLAASLDYEATLHRVAELGVPRLADWCAIGLLDDDGVRAVEAAAADPGKKALLRELIRGAPHRRFEAGHPAARALRTGEAQVLPRIADETIDAVTPEDPRSTARVRELAPRSAIIVPMVARERMLGLIVLAMAESGRSYGDSDLPPIVELGRRAALAIDNARLYHEAQEAVRVRDEIQRMVAHDLRSPLTAMSAALRMLRDRVSGEGGPAARPHKSIAIAERAAEQMERLIQDMLDVGRIEGRGMRLEKTSQDVAVLVDEAVDFHRDVATHRSITLRARHSPGLTPADVDGGRILQVLSNLIENALKFTPAGGRVVVRVERDGPELRFRISDTGPGIPEADREHVFERFWHARRTGRAGAGLGLAICKGIVEAHDGRIWVESEPGAGSTFHFTLPIDR